MMERQNIDIICGQETWLADTKNERWDTGELMINFGKEFGKDAAGNIKTKGRTEGVCFILNKKMAVAFEEGGKRVKKYCPRLASIRTPLSNQNLYIINAYAPDSGQTKAKREGFQRRLECALADCKAGETLILAGDFNASMGVAKENEDGVCGKHGTPHINDAGRQLRATASMHGLIDLVSREEQKFYGTWMHARSKKWHQLDRIFVREEDGDKVHKCINAEMVVDSDHYSARLHARYQKPQTKGKTKRKRRMQADWQARLLPMVETSKREKVVADIAAALLLRGEEEDPGSKLQKAVESVMDRLPTKKRTLSGWLELNYGYLEESIEDRNAAARNFARTKTEDARLELKRARALLKKKKKIAKNRWFKHMLQNCNGSTLPGGADGKNACATWTMAKKLNRGAKKWKQWVRQNVVDEHGQLGDGPATNADNFAACYETLFTNDVAEDGKADALHDEMEDVPTDRSWRGPSREEMRTAIGELRDTAPGVSGVPSLVWKALLLNEDAEQAMLEVMQWCWREKSVPESWSIFYMTVLEKKGDLTNPANYRGINTSETLSKAYSSILKNRLNLLHDQLAPEHCGGFRKGRGRGDCTCTAKQTLR